MRYEENSRNVLSSIPPDYSYLNEKTQPIAQKPIVPQAKHRKIKIEFTTFPFPKNNMVDDSVPDRNLTRQQRESGRRRDAYPKMGVRVRDTAVPSILDPKYPKYLESTRMGFITSTPAENASQQKKSDCISLPYRRQSPPILLPLPSMLQKGITRTDYFEKMNQRDLQQNPLTKYGSLQTSCSLSSLETVSNDEAVFWKHVKQPDFSDLDRMMIQQPMVIFMMQKKAKNPYRLGMKGHHKE